MTIELSPEERAAAERLIQWSLDEDLGTRGDVTTQALIGKDEIGTVETVVRKPGVVAGLPLADLLFGRLDPRVKCRHVPDGTAAIAGQAVAEFTGPVQSLLTAERTLLNLLTHLSGVATLTRRFAEAIAGTRARVYDTRKTLPGWRLLEKYAVRAGGGQNHRMGLYDMVLIKDNHLAGWANSAAGHTIAGAVEQARRFAPDLPIEIEVDTLEQLAEALAARPQMILLDNMPPPVLRQAVALRDAKAPGVELEASGGISLDNVADIARTGVERISVGALTHSAPALDLAFDWKAT